MSGRLCLENYEFKVLRERTETHENARNRTKLHADVQKCETSANSNTARKCNGNVTEIKRNCTKSHEIARKRTEQDTVCQTTFSHARFLLLLLPLLVLLLLLVITVAVFVVESVLLLLLMLFLPFVFAVCAHTSAVSANVVVVLP